MRIRVWLGAETESKRVSKGKLFSILWSTVISKQKLWIISSRGQDPQSASTDKSCLDVTGEEDRDAMKWCETFAGWRSSSLPAQDYWKTPALLQTHVWPAFKLTAADRTANNTRWTSQNKDGVCVRVCVCVCVRACFSQFHHPSRLRGGLGLEPVTGLNKFIGKSCMWVCEKLFVSVCVCFVSSDWMRQLKVFRCVCI